MTRQLRPGALTVRRATFTGLGAGVVALGCCVGPAVAALIGLSSAAVAVDLATDLYARWGWLFKIAGVVFAAGAVVLARREPDRCEVKPRLMRFTAIIVATGLTTYAALYAGTTWLGQQTSG